MNKILCLIWVFISFTLKAQFLPTDSLNFCEDSTTHSYMKYGSVTVGSYTCGSNKSIRIGNSTGADSVVFNLAVIANTDSVKLEVGMPWRGGAKNPKVWVENFRNDTIPYAGVGNCIPVFIKMGGLASRTNDGMIKVKLMDTIPGFTMDGQFTYIKVYSKVAVGTLLHGVSNFDRSLEIFPNPSSGIFYVKGGGEEVNVFNAMGQRIIVSKSREIDLSTYPKGIYYIRVGERTKKIIRQ